MMPVMMTAVSTSRLVSQCIHRPTVGYSAPIIMHAFFSTSISPDQHKNKLGQIPGITFNPNSVVAQLLPGGRTVLKKSRSGEMREVMVERAYGHFWMMRDLIKAGNKPVVASEISPQDAHEFPTLMNCKVLSNEEQVEVPNFFLQDNRARDPSAQCTLVGIAFNDYGYKLLSSWIDPFEDTFDVGNPRAKAIRLSITQGSFTKMFLSGYLTRSFRQSTPAKQQSQTLLCFGPDPTRLVDFNTRLGIHNTLTGYIYLLDGLGRVRFAGSGESTEKELTRLIQLAKDLTPRLSEPSNKRGHMQRSVKHYY